MSKIGDDRSIGTTPPQWWLDLFAAEYERRERANADAKTRREAEIYIQGTVQLGIELARLVGRPAPWNHSAVSRFINGKGHTIEMAEAFSLLYGLPRFQAVVRADTPEQARDLEMFLRRSQARIGSVDREIADLAQQAERQTAPVPSAVHGSTKGGGGGGRARRPGGRG